MHIGTRIPFHQGRGADLCSTLPAWLTGRQLRLDSTRAGNCQDAIQPVVIDSARVSEACGGCLHPLQCSFRAGCVVPAYAIKTCSQRSRGGPGAGLQDKWRSMQGLASLGCSSALRMTAHSDQSHRHVPLHSTPAASFAEHSLGP